MSPGLLGVGFLTRYIKGIMTMAANLVEITRNTRGLNSREIKYQAIGKYVPRTVEKESEPALDAEGKKTYDAKGNEVRKPLGKDAEGKQIIYKETVNDFVTEGVLTSFEDALALVDGNEQAFLDMFAEGFNEAQYRREAEKDELDDFLKTFELIDSDEKRDVFKRTARQVSRGTGTSVIEAAEMVKLMMEKKVAAAKAATA